MEFGQKKIQWGGMASIVPSTYVGAYREESLMVSQTTSFVSFKVNLKILPRRKVVIGRSGENTETNRTRSC